MKLASLPDAVERCVQDGDLVYLAGFTHPIPFAAGQEIIRQGWTDGCRDHKGDALAYLSPVASFDEPCYDRVA